MTVTIEQIQGFLQTRNLHYFTSPDNEALLLPYRLGPRLSVKVLVRVESQGRFLQIACNDLPMVEAGHPMIGQVQQCLLAFNHAKRFVKLSQDPADGEIVAAGDVWLENMEITEPAFDRMMGNFLECLKEAGEALHEVLEGRGGVTSEPTADDELTDAFRNPPALPDDLGFGLDQDDRDAA
jgi:hypothetical protein